MVAAMEPVAVEQPRDDIAAVPRLAVVDVETSGLSTGRHRVLQVAVVTIDLEGNVLDQWSSLVRPRFKWLFRRGPTHIHGLTRAALRAAPVEREVMAELAGRLGDATFTAHNAAFDVAFLRGSARRAGVLLPMSPYVCTLDLSRRLDPDRELSHRLADVCARYGVANERPHDALQDALATAAIVPHLLRANGIGGTAELDAYLAPYRASTDRAVTAPSSFQPAGDNTSAR